MTTTTTQPLPIDPSSLSCLPFVAALTKDRVATWHRVVGDEGDGCTIYQICKFFGHRGDVWCKRREHLSIGLPSLDIFADVDITDFWNNVTRDSQGCWIWKGAYRMITDKSSYKTPEWRGLPACHVAYLLSTSLRIPRRPGIVLRHMCAFMPGCKNSHGACVRPEHLRIGTTLENLSGDKTAENIIQKYGVTPDEIVDIWRDPLIVNTKIPGDVHISIRSGRVAWTLTSQVPPKSLSRDDYDGVAEMMCSLKRTRSELCVVDALVTLFASPTTIQLQPIIQNDDVTLRVVSAATTDDDPAAATRAKLRRFREKAAARQ